MISINVNSAASGAGLNLGKSNDALQKSLSRLSSGRRIVTSSDDAGGLAVSMKMNAALRRTESTSISLRNAQSFLETQDGAMEIAGRVLSRMSELAAMAMDPTKNDGDIENYDKEFESLRAQIAQIAKEKFNGVHLFNTRPLDEVSSTNAVAQYMTVPTSEDGSQTATITIPPLDIGGSIANLLYRFLDKSESLAAGYDFYTWPGDPKHEAWEGPGAYAWDRTEGETPVIPLSKNTASDLGQIAQACLQEMADWRAQNGAEQSRIGFAQDMLQKNSINLEASNSRIIDVDVAAESSQLARFQILQQAGTAMLAQANTSQQALLKLLQG